jgi:DNA repair protein RecN (Recombination protein N)
MLASLSIRDVVLIERLDLVLSAGLTVLTGETGAGKSILLDSLGLALGARSEQGLVRAGCTQASVAAVFMPPPGHPVFAMLADQGIEAESDVVLRRIVGVDGRSRAFVNDHPVGATLLKKLGALLVEVQGQGDQMGLADPTGHGALLDTYGVDAALRNEVAAAFKAWRAAQNALREAEDAIEAARRDEEWLRHATDELSTLAPKPGEEEQLATERQRLQHGERRAEAIASALSELTPRDRRSSGPGAALRAASRALQRLAPTEEANPAAPALAALERAEEALAEAETLLVRLAQDIEADPRLLEAAEERLFALRAAARKHNVQVAHLPDLLSHLRARLAALETGTAQVDELQRSCTASRTAYVAASQRLSTARDAAARRLETAIGEELPPLKLDRARFFVAVEPVAEPGWSATGCDGIKFLIATNPGQTPGPLGKIASGGELSRLMLALKVVLAGGSPVPTLVFDEVDSGIGGATAAAVGERLARVAEHLQVLLVTHSPQVAARGATHWRVAKFADDGRAETRVEPLEGLERQEEIARMLAGEVVTDEARAAAASLMGQMRWGKYERFADQP